MAKKTKKNNTFDVNVTERTYPVPLPDVANMDDLAYVTDDELSARHAQLESDRSKVISHGLDPMLWEIELAYVKREMLMRWSRREYHENWTREMYKQLAEEEALLPAAEFDNTSFMVS